MTEQGDHDFHTHVDVSVRCEDESGCKNMTRNGRKRCAKCERRFLMVLDPARLEAAIKRQDTRRRLYFEKLAVAAMKAAMQKNEPSPNA